MEEMMAARAPSVKLYVVRLSADEGRRLEAMIHKGKSSAAQLLKASILLISLKNPSFCVDHKSGGRRKSRRKIP